MVKILLIDDDPDVRTVIRISLEKQGYKVDTASNKEEAMTKIIASRPALILLDVLLSGSDGRELCREIKSGHKTSGIPIIMFSGHPGAASNYKSYGADDFLLKPFTSDALLEKMVQLTAS